MSQRIFTLEFNAAERNCRYPSLKKADAFPQQPFDYDMYCCVFEPKKNQGKLLSLALRCDQSLTKVEPVKIGGIGVVTKFTLVGTQLNLIHLLTLNGSFSSNFFNADHCSTRHFAPWRLFSDAKFDGQHFGIIWVTKRINLSVLGTQKVILYMDSLEASTFL
jgi:hypothetical protein